MFLFRLHLRPFSTVQPDEKMGQFPPTSQSERRSGKEAGPTGWGPGRNIRSQAAEITRFSATLSSIASPSRRHGWQKRQDDRSDEAVEGESWLSGGWTSAFRVGAALSRLEYLGNGVMKGSKSHISTHNVGFSFRALANNRLHEPPEQPNTVACCCVL